MNAKPNILLIMTDQQSRHMMSCAGNPHLQTPAMDSLAREGVRFEHAYCSNPVCTPSRISMTTGMMSCRLGASDNSKTRDAQDLPDEVLSYAMGNVMSRAGYDTFFGGKVHMPESLEPINAGFDAYFPDEREALPQACVDFIQQVRDRPFFAVASFINPHDICFAHRAKNGIDTHGVLALRKQALALPPDDLPALPANYDITQDEPAVIEAHLNPNAITPAITMRQAYDDYEWRINRWIYHRLTEQVDALVGEILKGLEAAGHEHDTLVIFTSDHGNMDASHRLASKGVPYEESVGVPFILKHPGHIAPGRTLDDALINTGLDIVPTLCDYAGIDKPPHLLGQSVRPLAEGREAAASHPYVVSENQWFRMLRGKRFKYCCFATSDEELLVDLENDPGECMNLARDPAYREALETHRRLLAEWMQRSHDDGLATYARGS
jgi:arylsulfatase A-like enzyme